MASSTKGIATGTKEATDAMSGKERRADLAETVRRT